MHKVADVVARTVTNASQPRPLLCPEVIFESDGWPDVHPATIYPLPGDMQKIDDGRAVGGGSHAMAHRLTGHQQQP
jgi:hypothetical protein